VERIMAPTLESLGIDRLTTTEKIALVQAIWDNIARSGDRPWLTDELRRELDRRVAEHEANPDDVIPWEQVLAEALARLGKKSREGFTRDEA
jgi:putative addiction module component (TIGR02574 family)